MARNASNKKQISIPTMMRKLRLAGFTKEARKLHVLFADAQYDDYGLKKQYVAAVTTVLRNAGKKIRADISTLIKNKYPDINEDHVLQGVHISLREGGKNALLEDPQIADLVKWLPKRKPSMNERIEHDTPTSEDERLPVSSSEIEDDTERSPVYKDTTSEEDASARHDTAHGDVEKRLPRITNQLRRKYPLIHAVKQEEPRNMGKGVTLYTVNLLTQGVGQGAIQVIVKDKMMLVRVSYKNARTSTKSNRVIGRTTKGTDKLDDFVQAAMMWVASRLNKEPKSRKRE